VHIEKTRAECGFFRPSHESTFSSHCKKGSYEAAQDLVQTGVEAA